MMIQLFHDKAIIFLWIKEIKLRVKMINLAFWLLLKMFHQSLKVNKKYPIRCIWMQQNKITHMNK